MLFKHYCRPKSSERNFKSFVNGLEILNIAKIWRSERNMEKCELGLLFYSKLLHDVAYRVICMMLDSGNSQKITHSVLVTEYLHTIFFYFEDCKV